MTQQQMLKKLQELSFALVELNLFLDTHPDNARARELYNTYSKQMHDLRNEYFENYGPTMNFGVCPAGDSFSWINSPWPWEN